MAHGLVWGWMLSCFLQPTVNSKTWKLSLVPQRWSRTDVKPTYMAHVLAADVHSCPIEVSSCKLREALFSFAPVRWRPTCAQGALLVSLSCSRWLEEVVVVVVSVLFPLMVWTLTIHVCVRKHVINCLVGNVVSINVELTTLDDCGLLQGFLWMETSALYRTEVILGHFRKTLLDWSD